MTLNDKAKKISVVILDVDGVLTDGQIGYDGSGEEIKFFNVKDGHAIKLLGRAGFRVGILSGRASKANEVRAAELGMDFLMQNEKIKIEAFERLLKELKVSAEECLYMGDDVVDIPVFRACGIGVAVADAVDEAKHFADMVTETPGGRGAVREIAVWLLKIQEKWNSVTSRYF